MEERRSSKRNDRSDFLKKSFMQRAAMKLVEKYFYERKGEEYARKHGDMERHCPSKRL